MTTDSVGGRAGRRKKVDADSTDSTADVAFSFQLKYNSSQCRGRREELIALVFHWSPGCTQMVFI